MTDNNADETDGQNSKLSRRTAMALMGTSAVGGAAATGAFSELTADRPIDVEVVSNGDAETADSGSSELQITNNSGGSINAEITTANTNVSLVGLTGSSSASVSGSNPWTLTGLGASETANIEYEHASSNTNVDFNVTAFAGTSGFSIGTQQTVSVAQANVVAEYLFEDDSDTSTAVDTVGTFDGTISDASYSSDAKVGSLSMQFDGTSSTEVLTGRYGGATTGSASFTVTAWVKPSTETTRNPVVTKGTTRSGSQDWSFGVGGGQFYIHTNNASNNLTGVGSIPTGSWTFVTMVVDSGATEVRAYSGDATQAGSTNYSGSLTDDYDVRIGGNAETNSGGFSGVIDNVKIWDKALTEAEISDEYNQY